MISIKSWKKLTNIKKAGAILKPNSPNIKDAFLEIKNLFKNENIELLLEKESALMLGETNGVGFDTLCQTCDFLVSIGGDGTLISVARRSSKYDIAILGIHLGTFGFLTDVKVEELPSFLKNLKSNKYKIEERMMIEGSINGTRFLSFNDIVISRKSVNMLKVEAKVDSKPFNLYNGDAVIISTPTGSTAYNLSSGGPVVYPLANAFIVTPVAAHSLTQRPIVLPADLEMEFCTIGNHNALVIVDGQDIYEIGKDDILKIKIAKKKAKLIHTECRDYFEVLRKKLQWGNAND